MNLIELTENVSIYTETGKEINRKILVNADYIILAEPTRHGTRIRLSTYNYSLEVNESIETILKLIERKDTKQ
jgi:hypothetical protein